MTARRFKAYGLGALQVFTVFPVLMAIMLGARLATALCRWARLDVVETWREHWRAIRWNVQ